MALLVLFACSSKTQGLVIARPASRSTTPNNGAKDGSTAVRGGDGSFANSSPLGSLPPGNGPSVPAPVGTCGDEDPGGPVREATMSAGVQEDPSVGYQPDPTAIAEISITPKTREPDVQWATGTGRTIILHGPTGRGPNGTMTFNLDNLWTTEDFIGVKVTNQGSHAVLDCSPVSNGLVESEAEVLSEGVLRDTQGKLLFIIAPSTPTGVDGKVFYTPELAPEVSMRWVDTGDKCELRKLGIELTSVKTGQKAVAAFERRGEIDIDGQTYVLVLGHINVPSDPQHCNDAQWNLYRKGLVHPI